MKQNNTNITELYSKIGDIDLADAATQFAMAQSVYRRALPSWRKLSNPRGGFLS
jgi:flagellar hook-associated protein 3 FlgL